MATGKYQAWQRWNADSIVRESDSMIKSRESSRELIANKRTAILSRFLSQSSNKKSHQKPTFVDVDLRVAALSEPLQAVHESLQPVRHAMRHRLATAITHHRDWLPRAETMATDWATRPLPFERSTFSGAAQVFRRAAAAGARFAFSHRRRSGTGWPSRGRLPLCGATDAPLQNASRESRCALSPGRAALSLADSHGRSRMGRPLSMTSSHH